MRLALLALALLAGAPVALGVVWLRASIAPLTGAHPVSGLARAVTIRFDDFARPYVEAEGFEDALVAEGWLHASHRLFQMDLHRRAGSGRLSELLGAGMLETDEQLWRAGVPQLAATLAANASRETRGRVDAYVAGVNAALAAAAARPPEYLLLRQAPRPWAPADVFALAALMAYQSANNAGQELLRLALQAELAPERFAIFLPDEAAQPDFPFLVSAPDPGWQEALAALRRRRARLDPRRQPLLPDLALGSNGWVVAPSRSATGHALVAFDSHDGLGLPSLSYEVHLSFAGRSLHGWSAAGLPGVVNGYNDRVAWGFTNIGDTQDLFVETRAPDDPLRFRDGDEWYRADLETVEIPVAGRDAPHRLALVRTRNGLLLSEDPPISLRWTGHELAALGLGIDALFAFNLAQSAADFSVALDALPAPALNATFADVDGHIGFQTAGVFPVRGRGEGLVPLAGAEPAHRWQGFVPAARLPRRRDPAEGFLAAANARVNRPGEGPLVSADNAPGYRIRRIHAVLGGAPSLSVEDMRALQMDWRDAQAEQLLGTLLAALDAASLSARERAAHDALAAWRREPVAGPESGAALLFQAWYLAIAREVFAPALQPATFAELLQHNYVLNHALDRLLRAEPESGWWRGDRPGLLRAAFAEAVAGIAAVQGDEVSGWRLDRQHAVRLQHELGKAVPLLGWLFDAAPAPWGGSAATVGRARYRYDRPFDVSGGATVRFVAELRPGGPRVRAVIPGGQSGHPSSPHYLDQLPAWLAGELIPIAAPRPEEAGGVLTLVPASR
jgi:penicillin amidase